MKVDIMRKAIKAMLKKNECRQKSRHEWESFVKWLDGQEVFQVDPVVTEVIGEDENE